MLFLVTTSADGPGDDVFTCDVGTPFTSNEVINMPTSLVNTKLVLFGFGKNAFVPYSSFSHTVLASSNYNNKTHGIKAGLQRKLGLHHTS